MHVITNIVHYVNRIFLVYVEKHGEAWIQGYYLSTVYNDAVFACCNIDSDTYFALGKRTILCTGAVVSVVIYMHKNTTT